MVISNEKFKAGDIAKIEVLKAEMEKFVGVKISDIK
jgi:hypothetical protein